MVWMAGTAPGINGIEIEIARRFVSLWKSSRDKFRQRFAERIERQPHSARGRDRRYVASRWEFETWSHESLGAAFKASQKVASAPSHSGLCVLNGSGPLCNRKPSGSLHAPRPTTTHQSNLSLSDSIRGGSCCSPH